MGSNAGIRLTIIGLIGSLGTYLLETALFVLFWSRQEAAIEAGELLGSQVWFSMARSVTSLMVIGFAVVVALGLARHRRSLVDPVVRNWGLAAVVGWSATVPLLGILRVMWLLAGSGVVKHQQWHGLLEVLGLVCLAVDLAAVVTLVVCLFKVARRRSIVLPSWLAGLLALFGLWHYGYPLLLRLQVRLVEGFMPSVALSTLMRAGFIVCLLLLLRSYGRALPLDPCGNRADPSSEPGDLNEPGWSDAASGLGLYRAGVLIQIGVAILGLLLVRLSASSRDVGQIKGTLVCLAVVSLLVMAVPFAGLIRYARVPAESGGRGGARLGVSMFGIVALLNLITVGLTINAASSSSVWALFDLLKDQLPIVEGLSYLVGLMGMLALVRSLGAVAAHLEMDSRSRVAFLSVAIPVMAVFAAAAKLFARQMPVAVLLMVGVSVLAGAIVMLCLYLGLIKQIARRIEQGCPSTS